MLSKVSVNSVNLIGIHGPLNGGKDTVANYLQAKFPDRFNRYAFAKPIKQACVILFGFTPEQMEDRVLKEQIDPFWGFSPRRAMQLLGTEYGRNMLRKDVWIQRAALEVMNNIKIKRGTIITDVRFENEAEWLREQPGAVLIYLQVPDLTKDDRYAHESEQGISFVKGFDHLIVNDKSLGLSNLFKQIDEMIE